MPENGSVNGLALKLHRVALGLSRPELSAKCGKSETWLRRIEGGKGRFVLTDLDLYRLAMALGIKPSDLEA